MKKTKGKIMACVSPIFRKIGFEIIAARKGRNYDSYLSVNKFIQDKGADFSILDAALESVIATQKIGHIVEIGANDGKSHDLVRKYILKYALPGILVEPNPVVFERLKKNYADQPQLFFENVAIGESAGNMTLYTFLPSQLSDMLYDIKEGSETEVLVGVWGGGKSLKYSELSVYASLDRKSIEYTKRVNRLPNKIHSIEVPVITFSMLLERHHLTDIMLLAIDTEGYDLKILQSIDLDKYKPQIILYEHCFADRTEEIECANRLIQNGYRVYRTLGADTIAVLTNNSSNEKIVE
jgi:FkbM family methyltransferase